MPKYSQSAYTKAVEGLKLRAYRCPAGVLTIGYGHTGRDVTEGQTITEEEADGLFVADIAIAEHDLTAVFSAGNWTQGQWDALVDLAFNLGAFEIPKKAPKLTAAVRVGNWTEAAKQLLDITNGGLPGLVARRKREAEWMVRTEEAL